MFAAGVETHLPLSNEFAEQLVASDVALLQSADASLWGDIPFVIIGSLPYFDCSSEPSCAGADEWPKIGV